jgi:hypothetical protein
MSPRGKGEAFGQKSGLSLRAKRSNLSREDTHSSQERLLRRSAPRNDLGRLGDALAFLLPLAVYLLTLPPGLTWAHDGADGGDLIAAARTLGIPHPPGYPLYTLLARVFLWIPWGVPAHRIALLSAVAGAGAAWALYRLCLLVGAKHWGGELPSQHSRRRPILRPYMIALAASLLWAFAPIPWGQAVIAEVYALNALLTVGFLACLLWWRQTGEPRAWRLAWLLFGLGIAHHPLIAACLLPAALWAWEQRARLTARRWAEAVGLPLLGLCFYVYLPIRAAASPPINWGNPQTLPGLWWVVSAAPYRHFVLGLPLAEWLSRLSAWAGLLLSQFKVWGVALGLWGALMLHERDKKLSWGLLGVFTLVTLYALGYNTTDSYVYLLPALAVFAVWIAWGLADAGQRLAGLLRRSAPHNDVVAAIILAALPLASLGMNWAASDLSRDQEAQAYVEQSLAVLPADAVVLADGDRQTFALWYARRTLPGAYRGEVISLPLLQYDWYRAQVQTRNPDLALPSQSLSQERFITEFITANRSRRPIFLTARDAAVERAFGLQPAGPLFKVQTK